MKPPSVAVLWVLTAGLLLGSGCVEHRAVQEGAPAAANYSRVVVTEAPPRSPVEIVGAPPGPEYVWMPGVWEWRGDWVWVPGQWVMRPQPHAIWIPGRWAHRQQGWIWVRGYWR